jgi:hypothetical protein
LRYFGEMLAADVARASNNTLLTSPMMEEPLNACSLSAAVFDFHQFAIPGHFPQQAMAAVAGPQEL